MIFLYFIPVMLFAALLFERLTDKSRRRQRPSRREYGRASDATKRSVASRR